MILTFDTRGNEKQKECCRAWIDDSVTDILLGGAKGGAKSYTGAKLIFGDALIYPGTYYFIARNELSALRKFTIPTIYEVFEDWKIDITKYTKFNGQDNLFECYNKSRVYLLDAAYMPSDPMFMRFGSLQFTRGWGEEIGEWHEAAKNNLSAAIGRWKNDVYNLVPKFLGTCNPSKNFIYREYYKPWREGTLPKWKRFIQSLPTDNKMLPKGYIEQLEKSLSPQEKQRLLHGNWEWDDDPAALIEYDKILDIFTNSHVAEGRKCITVDVARLGGDRIVIIIWNGWRGKVYAAQRQGLDTTAAIIEDHRYRMKIGVSDVLVDEDGVGGGMVDFCKFKGFVNNSTPLPNPVNGSIKENFDNLKSQCYFRLAQRINSNGLYLECDEWMKPLIIEELEQVKQKALDSDMKKGVIPKDRVKELLGRSPDFADTLMMREWFDLKPQIKLTAVAI